MNYIKEIEDLYNSKQKEYIGFQNIDTAYLFTNENLKGYIKDVSNKKILSIASSGDHYFSYLLNGATKVDVFDINYLSKIIISLKKAAITYLDYDLFLDFFGINNTARILDYDIFKKISTYLDEETYRYWIKIYTMANKNGSQIYNSNLIVEYTNNNKDGLSNFISYLNEEEFIRLKGILSTTPDIHFIHTDINNIEKKLTENYDEIFLSNINMYQNNTHYLKQIKKLAKHLKENGQIYFAYIYNYGKSNYSRFYDNLLKSQKYDSKTITTEEKKRTDKVYIYKKVA